MIVFSLYLLFVRPQRARRRLRRGPGRRAGAGGPLPRRRSLRARRGGAGRRRARCWAPGSFVAAGSGLAPLAFGGAVLQSAVVDLHLPLLGDVHLVTSVFFDIGVYLVVVGLVLDLLRSLGSGIDRHILREERERPRSGGGGRREREPDPDPDRRRPDRLRCLPGARAQPDPGPGRPGACSATASTCCFLVVQRPRRARPDRGQGRPDGR